MRIFNSKSGTGFKIWLLCLSLLLTSSSAVQEKQPAVKQGDGCSYYANACLPERLLLTLTENPSKSQAVTWRTCAKVNYPKAQIASVIDSPALQDNLRTINAVSEKVSRGKDKFVYHYSAVFEALKPDTIYAYRVGTYDNWSEWNQFKTACTSDAPFKFVYFGDPQENVKSMCSRIFRAAYKKAPDADFWLFVGDLVTNGDKDGEWAELFDAFGWIPRMTPMMLIPGNHDYPDKRYLHAKPYELFPLWRPHVTLPENGLHGLEETAYYIDYQGVRFVMLNGNEKIEEQARWLDRILSENHQRWTILGIHQPVYSTTSKGRKDSKLQNQLVPIFDKHSVDLVLQGHNHTYSRTYEIKNGVRTGDNEKGTVYVISVSGPKFYEVKTQQKDLMAKIETGRQLFQVIHIDHNRLLYESFDVTGEVYDSFTLEK
jgi:predicted phosphodiesterase